MLLVQVELQARRPRLGQMKLMRQTVSSSGARSLLMLLAMHVLPWCSVLPLCCDEHDGRVHSLQHATWS
jgi:hypothetical protein